MPERPLDPAHLEGEALERWYRRSAAEIEAERRAEAQWRYDEYFGTCVSGEPPTVQALGDGSFNRAHLLRGMGDDEAELLLIGNPANPRLRREWEQKYGRPWPKDPLTGRNYDVAHARAKADGGTDTLDNIRPMHPDEHQGRHKVDRDHERWGRRPGIARAFGGTVARSLGPLGVLSGLIGLVTGGVRTDKFDNFVSDMMGWYSQDDYRKAVEEQQRAINPNWKPGDGISV